MAAFEVSTEADILDGILGLGTLSDTERAGIDRDQPVTSWECADRLREDLSSKRGLPMTNYGRLIAVAGVLSLAALTVASCTQPRVRGEVAELQVLAEQGNADAQYNLGHLSEIGDGVPLDDAEAVRWIRLAAEQGNADAQYNLGARYAYGSGVPQDDVQAHIWYNLAASRLQTDLLRESSARSRDEVAKRMTPEQIAEAQRLAREWDAAHPREP